jgi:acid phosphatase
MGRRVLIALGTGLLLLAAVAAVLVNTSEDVEHLFKSEAAPYRPPHGEWIQSVQGRRAEVWAVGDSGPPDAALVAQAVARADPDRVLYLGDVYPGGSAADFETWDRAWAALVPRMAPTPGNHDWAEATDGYDPYWEQATGEPPPTHYSFHAGPWEILVLNSEHEEREAQIRWVEETTAAGGNCRIAIWHRPRWSAGPHGDDPSADDFWRAIHGRAAIVLSGHEHNMQRLRAIDGVVEFVSGAGGFSHTTPAAQDERLAFGDGRHNGALRLQLLPRRARWSFVAVDGQVLDTGLIRCHS